MSAVATSDSQAIALLCAPLRVGEAKPLSPGEWARVATAIHGSEVAVPSGLLGMAVAELASALAVEDDLAERLARLLDRGGPFAFELERLADRGIWLLTRADDAYPTRIKQRLGLKAPPVLFGSGARELLSERAVAVVGSRDASEAALNTTRAIAEQLAREGVAVVSGGARGVDRAGMDAATRSGGVVVGFVADSLVRLTQQPETRRLLVDDQLVLLTPFAPDARFTVGNAMSRNKLIYCGADAAVVVATTQGSGGTWSGAIETLRSRWVPIWVWVQEAAPAGNRSLAAAGARPLADTNLHSGSLFETLTSFEAAASPASQDPSEPGLPDLESPETRSFLGTPRSEVELRDKFDLQLGQVRSWMKRCVDAGNVIRREAPVRYVIADVEREVRPSLFDDH